MFLLASCNLIFLDVPEENDPSNNTMICDADIPPSDQHENTSDLYEHLGSKVWNGIRLSESSITFKEVASIEKFSIVVNGLVLDSELSKHLKPKYHELCCSQGMFLHENLVKGQNCKLVVGMICETINLADAIRASKITTSSDTFAVWNKSLKGLEIFGMNVSFLLARLEQLMSLASKSKRYTKTRIKRDQAEEEKKVLQLKLEEVKKDRDVDNLLQLRNNLFNGQVREEGIKRQCAAHSLENGTVWGIWVSEEG
ncbi:hypothetical protein K1719_014552 [Acacia pycnantha]|nr:hypothetical protein K1719_014552 [Acacia pycnantha]